MSLGIVNKFWSAEQIAKLQELYPDHTNLHIAEVLAKKEAAIIAKAFKLKLRKTKEFMRACSAKSTLKPGWTPHNKGKKQTEWMTTEGIAKSAATHYPKGHLPHNTKEADGVIVVRQKEGDPLYKYIRISLGKWVLLQRHNWEAMNGPVPTSHCLWCLGDTLDCDPKNWELITRKENRIRNSGTRDLTDKRVANYLATTSRTFDRSDRDAMLKQPELIKAKRTQLLINRKIRNHGKEQNNRS